MRTTATSTIAHAPGTKNEIDLSLHTLTSASTPLATTRPAAPKLYPVIVASVVVPDIPPRLELTITGDEQSALTYPALHAQSPALVQVPAPPQVVVESQKRQDGNPK